jgi:glutathione S-transferase
MSMVYAVMGLALLQYLFFGMAVGAARGRHGVKAPATTGNEIFERYYRVQMNTLELLIVLVPALPLFAYYVSVRWAVVLGLVYVVGRFVYFFAYVKAPEKRGLGYLLSYVPAVAMLVGGLGAAALAAFRG